MNSEINRSVEGTVKTISLNDGMNSQHDVISQANTEYFPKDQSLDNGGTDEEDIRDDMSDYYKMKSKKITTKGSSGHNKPVLVSTSTSQLPTQPPDRQSHTKSSDSSPADLMRFSRPQSAPDDRRKLSEQIDTNRHQAMNHTNILLPGGTYVDTGNSSRTKSNTKSFNSSSKQTIVHPSPKRIPQGVTYNMNGKKEKTRPSSTSRMRGNPQIQPKSHDMNRALHRMFDDDLIDDLDAVMRYPKTTQPTRSTDPRSYGSR